MQLDHYGSPIDHGAARDDRCTSVVDGGTIHVDFHNESVTFVHNAGTDDLRRAYDHAARWQPSVRAGSSSVL